MKIVTGLFDSYRKAEDAVSALEAAGIPADEISLLSRDYADNVSEGAGAGAGVGALAGGTGGLLAGLGLMAIPGVGPVVAAGWLAATAAGAAAGAVVGGAAGGIIGALTSAGVPEEDAHVFAEGVRRGGTLVTVRAEDQKVHEVEAIMRTSGWIDIDSRRGSYIEQGWQRFDDTEAPYNQTQIEEERRRYDRDTL